MSDASDTFPGRAEIRALVGGLGPSTLFDLFAGYGVAAEHRFDLLEEALALLVLEGRRAPDLRLWFLETLEERCRLYRDGREPARERT